MAMAMTHYVHQFMEAVAPEAGDELIGPRCLVLAPHPDDEVLGCGGTIARAVRDGTDVWIGFLTDGRHGVVSSTDDPIALRKAEAIKASETLGVSPDRLIFLGYEDGRLNENINQVIERIRALVDSLHINVLFIPYRGDWHPDHHVTWTIGDACRRNGTRVVEYPIWFGPWLLPRLGWRSTLAAAAHLRDIVHVVKVPITGVLDIKRRALAAYESQLSAFASQSWGPDFLANFLGDHELFFLRSGTDAGIPHWWSQIVRTLRVTARILPSAVRRRLQSRLHKTTRWPPVGWVQFGSLRRVTPISRAFGFERGRPVDRYYIEHFLSAHTKDIRGHVLEIGDDDYTRRFGGARVTKSDVLHVMPGNKKATIVADLTAADIIPTNTFDCILLTQTLNAIYDMRAALRTAHHIMRPGGVLLATLPGICQISGYDMDRWGDYWRVTTLAARKLFEECFPGSHVQVQAYGNVLAAVAFLHGLAVEDLRDGELDHRDPDYDLTVAIRAVKPEE